MKVKGRNKKKDNLNNTTLNNLNKNFAKKFLKMIY